MFNWCWSSIWKSSAGNMMQTNVSTVTSDLCAGIMDDSFKKTKPKQRHFKVNENTFYRLNKCWVVFTELLQFRCLHQMQLNVWFSCELLLWYAFCPEGAPSETFRCWTVGGVGNQPCVWTLDLGKLTNLYYRSFNYFVLFSILSLFSLRSFVVNCRIKLSRHIQDFFFFYCCGYTNLHPSLSVFPLYTMSHFYEREKQAF